MAEAALWGDAHRRFVIAETLVNTVLSALLSAAFVWGIFGGRARIPLWGMDGVAFDFVPMTLAIAFMMTLGLTLYTRRRCAGGRAPLLGSKARLPRVLPLRALLLAAAFGLALVPPVVGLLALIGRRDYGYGEVMAMKIVYGALVAALVTPLIVTEAMRDGARSRRSTSRR